QPGRPFTRLVQMTATATGPAEVRIEAVEKGESGSPLDARTVATLPVRPAAALHAAVEFQAIPAGQTLQVEPPDVFVKGMVQMTVSVSAKPSVNLEAALEEQIRYPYGCVEQTSSRLFSLL